MERKNSTSGIKKISFARLSDFKKFRIRHGVGYASLSEGASFEEIPFSSIKELNLEEQPYSITANIPTPCNANSISLSKLVGVDLILKLEMTSGTIYYLGCDRFPGSLTFSNNNSGEIGQHAGYLLVVKSISISLFKEYVFESPTTPNQPGEIDFTPALIFDSSLTPLPPVISTNETNVSVTYKDNSIEVVKSSDNYNGYLLFAFNLYYLSNSRTIGRIGRFKASLTNNLSNTPSRVRVKANTRGVIYFKDIDFLDSYSIEFDTRRMDGWQIEGFGGVTPSPNSDYKLINITPLHYDTRTFGSLGHSGEKVISIKDFVLDYLGN